MKGMEILMLGMKIARMNKEGKSEEEIREVIADFAKAHNIDPKELGL